MNLRDRMRRNLERVRSEPGLKKNVSVIGALIALALVAGGFILGNQRFDAPWQDKFLLSAEFEAAPGVSPGNGQEVRMAGVIVGQISGGEVNKNGRAELTMSLEPDVEIYDNARLVLRPKSPLNEMYVTIAPGGPPGKRLASGHTLPVTNTVRPVQVDEVLAELDDGSRAALTTLLSEADDALASAPAKLPAGLDATTEVLGDLQPVVEQLATRRDALRRLVSSLGQVSTAVGDNDKRLTDLADSLQSTLGVVADGQSELDSSLAQLPDLVAKLDGATSEVAALTEQLDPTLRSVKESSEALPGALRDLTSTVDELDTTVDLAEPVMAKARPVIADLRPFTTQLRTATPGLVRIGARLDPITKVLTKYLPDLGAFMVNTRSVTSMRDANGGILRAMAVVTPTTFPTNLLAGLGTSDVDGPLG
ncbi:MlaD family protein [Nocardioides dubius]|uniref:Mce/MlaD domain-containing protein n=1 Tax=Nocardioides dubius TaxID=317019 RepID=A0ABP4EKN7_9ACTN